MASPSITIGGIACTVPFDSGVQESEADGEPEATVVFRCDYGERFQLLRALRGELIWAGGTSYTRTPGFAYPDSPNLICLDVTTIQGVGTFETDQATGWPRYPKADLTARFRVPPYDVRSGQYWSLELDTSGEFVTFPGTSWRFVGGGLVGAELARPMPQTRISYTVHRLPFIPQEIVKTLTNKLNASAYAVGGTLYPAGTLLFLGARTSAAASADGYEYTASYQLQARQEDWNKIWNPNTFSWTYVSSDGTMSGVMPFEYADFSIIPV